MVSHLDRLQLPYWNFWGDDNKNVLTILFCNYVSKFLSCIYITIVCPINLSYYLKNLVLHETNDTLTSS